MKYINVTLSIVGGLAIIFLVVAYSQGNLKMKFNDHCFGCESELTKD